MTGLPLGSAAGMAESLHFGESDDTFTINRVQDVEPFLDANKRAQSDGEGWSPSREWRRVASIPPVVVEIWKKQWGVDPLKPDNHKLLKRLLNDPENQFLRVSDGRF
jgi:hypothetical protein